MDKAIPSGLRIEYKVQLLAFHHVGMKNLIFQWWTFEELNNFPHFLYDNGKFAVAEILNLGDIYLIKRKSIIFS